MAGPRTPRTPRRPAGPAAIDAAAESVLSACLHDAGNPLSSIVMNANHLLHTWPAEDTGSTRRRQVEIIAREGERLHQMLRDVVDALHVQTGRTALSPAPCDAAFLLREAIARSAPAAEQAGVRLELQAPDERQVPCDRDRIVKAIAYLLDAIVKEGSRGDTAIVSGAWMRGSWRCSIALAGPVAGAAPGSPGRAARTSLATLVARGIIEAHGGRLLEGGGRRERAVGFTLPGDGRPREPQPRRR